MDVVTRVREAIYSTIAATGRLPSAPDVARRLALEPREVDAAFRALADAHVVVPQRGSATELWSAPPFAGVPTAFRVRPAGAGPDGWYAPCAWDAFGIPAALKQDVHINA